MRSRIIIARKCAFLPLSLTTLQLHRQDILICNFFFIIYIFQRNVKQMSKDSEKQLCKHVFFHVFIYFLQITLTASLHAFHMKEFQMGHLSFLDEMIVCHNFSIMISSRREGQLRKHSFYPGCISTTENSLFISLNNINCII